MRFLIIYFFLLVSFLTDAQGGFRTRHILQNSLNNTSKAIFEISPGNYIAGGIVVDSLNGFNFNRLVIMGLNYSGQIQWTKKYGNKNFEYLDNTFISRSFYKRGNFIYHTACVKDSTNGYLGVLIKFNMIGDTVWQKIYRDTTTGEYIIPQMLTSSIDGGFLITGMFENTIGVGRYCMLIKTDANGNELWRKKIGKSTYPNVQDGKAIIQDSASKKIIIVGYQYIGGSEAYTNLLFLDSLGNKLNQFGFVKGLLTDLIQTKDKKFVAVGNRIVTIIPNYLDNTYSYAFKFDINSPGQVIWQMTNFDKLARGNFFSCLTELRNGNILVAGTIDTAEAITGTLQTLNRFTEISQNGNIVSNRYYNYAANDSISNNNTILSIETTSDGGWVTACRITNGVNPFFFVKYDSTGCDSSTAYCATVNLVGLNEVSKNFDFNFEMYPNPTNEKINFTIQAPMNKTFSVKLTDISGKELELLNLEANDPFTLNAINYKPGVYFVNLIYEGKSVETKKLIIIR